MQVIKNYFYIFLSWAQLKRLCKQRNISRANSTGHCMVSHFPKFNNTKLLKFTVLSWNFCWIPKIFNSVSKWKRVGVKIYCFNQLVQMQIIKKTLTPLWELELLSFASNTNCFGSSNTQQLSRYKKVLMHKSSERKFRTIIFLQVDCSVGIKNLLSKGL